MMNKEETIYRIAEKKPLEKLLNFIDVKFDKMGAKPFSIMHNDDVEAIKELIKQAMEDNGGIQAVCKE